MAWLAKGSWSRQEQRAANASLLRLSAFRLPSFNFYPTLSLALNYTQWQQLIKQIYPSNRLFDLLALTTPAIWYRQHPAIPAYSS
jgi:hypothetical protein